GFSYFSNYGTTTVDIAAPGRNIESALPGSIVGEMTGTSVSAAMVSAYAAITLAMDAQLTPISAKEKLIATSDRLSNLQDKVDGGRRLNAKNIIAGIEVTDITQVSAADDFDVASYTPLVESAAFELFTKKKATKIETGDGFCLALLEDGTVWAWGKNNHGQLGNNTLINSYYPVRVIGLSNITAISAGNGHAMAMDSNRKIWSWGDNAYGQLGLGDHVDRKIAQQVTAGVSGSDNSNERVVLGGNFSIVHGMTAGGEVNLYACGDNTYGQIGNGTFGGSYATFTAVTFGVWNWITDIVAGQAHAFILSNERAYGWGLNSDGQLGNGTYVNVAKPAMQHDLISKVACGDYHTLILKKDGMGYGFGNNGNARIGETLPPGTTEPILKHPNPIYIFQSSTNDPITQISGGATHSGILFKSGEAMLWGSNYSGELGVVTPGEYTGTLQHFTDFTDVTQLSLGKASSAMIRADGTIWMAGDNLYGQRGDESACFVSPQNVPELTGAVDIKTGERTSIALMQGGLVKTWGDNSTNLLGMPDVKFSYKPKQLAEPRNIGWVDPSGIAVDSNSYVYPGGASSMTSKTYHWGGDKTVPTLEVLTIDIDKYSNALHTLLLTKSGEIRDCTIPCTHTYCNGLSGGMTNVKDV
ncbi:MAG: S8 family serine peptidase, partial [Clostridia bacterium]